MTTEQAIDYVQAICNMNELNIMLAREALQVEVEQEEIWTHEAIKLVLLQAKSNLFLEQLAKVDRGENDENTP